MPDLLMKLRMIINIIRGRPVIYRLRCKGLHVVNMEHAMFVEVESSTNDA